MLDTLVTPDTSKIHQLRRAELRSRIKEAHPQVKQGVVLLSAGFESERTPFRQESSFYYLTGITEPGVVMLMELSGKTTLFVPASDMDRSAWLVSDIARIQQHPKEWDIEQVIPLGKSIAGFQMHPFTPAEAYESLIAHLSTLSSAGYTLFAFSPNTPGEYVEQRIFLSRICSWVPGLQARVHDIAPLLASMRRYKDVSEIEALYHAVDITMTAHEAVAHALEPGMNEAEVQATAEYIMIGSQSRPAFPTIVGSGKNSTVLHYHANSQPLAAGDVVVVDMGAEANYYCADITRTYPVSGSFTARQREVYQHVLDTQEYVASIAKPGMWLFNKDKPAESLHHRAVEFLTKRGYEKYFIHGIGHFLGLDVHDVGDRTQPLEEGDVFTIEPGIYIAAEKIGVRIEDNYWMTKDGVVCLSDELPKSVADIEALVQKKNDDDDVSVSFESDEYDIAQS